MRAPEVSEPPVRPPEVPGDLAERLCVDGTEEVTDGGAKNVFGGVVTVGTLVVVTGAELAVIWGRGDGATTVVGAVEISLLIDPRS